MTRLESIYFDFIRVTAALLVLAGHAITLMPGNGPVANFGHEAVVAFFVLSGYVIAFVADGKERDLRTYAVSRAARIFSVALPAVALTLLFDFVGLHANGRAIYLPYAGDWPLIRIVTAISFSSELWFLSIQPFSNGPYWSLCYEVWYYALFAAATYLSGRRRIVWLVVLCAIAGPKILVMFPLWLLGVAVYRYRVDVGAWLGGGLFVASLIGMAAFVTSSAPLSIARHMRDLLGEPAYRLMAYSQNAPADYVLGLMLAANFLSVRGLADRVVIPRRLAIAIRWIAGSTFSIYLFHRPIMVMFIAVANPEPRPVAMLSITLATIGAAILLSVLTERRKALWRNGFARLADVAFNRPPAPR